MWLGILGGMIFGAAIVWGTLLMVRREMTAFLPQDQTPAGPQFNAPVAVISRDPELSVDSDNLCQILTLTEVNSVLTGRNLISSGAPATFDDRNPEVPAGQCFYFASQSQIPVVSFTKSLYGFKTLQEIQSGLISSIKDLSNLADEAFFSSVQTEGDLKLNSIFFRIGDSVYSVSGPGLSEQQLRSLVSIAVNKLR